MKTLVLSDIHLDVAPLHRQRTDRFVSFLRSLDPSQVNRIFILGDLFDFWFEYRHVVFSGYFDVLRAFADLRGQGVECHLVCGNHDFWAGRFLEEHLGFTIHANPLEIHFGDLRVLMAHGDGFNKKDLGYLAFKRIARCRFVIAAFRLLHPDWAMAIARCVSRVSRKTSQAKDLSKGAEVEPIRTFAREALAQGRADVVLCGHSHFPTREEFATPTGAGLYLNAGDWLYHRSCVEWDGRAFRLIQAANS